MSEVELPIYDSIVHCRYCLSDDNVPDLIAPCKCKGSAKYVHKKCLKEWFVKKNQSVVIPAAFRQFDQCCEICHTKYKFSYEKIDPRSQLWCDIFVYICVITNLLLVSYIGVGLLLDQWKESKQLFTSRGNQWENIFYNGFIMVHIILGIFYITVTIANGCMSRGGADDGFFCCWFGGNCGGDCGEDGCIFLFGILVLIGILGTVLIIYYDIISRVVQRHENRCYIVADIEQYEQSE